MPVEPESSSVTSPPPTVCSLFCATRALPLIFLANFLRLFSYAAIAVVFINDLVQLSAVEATAVVVCCYVGDFIVSNIVTSNADAIFGRRLALSMCALLMIAVGLPFYFSRLGPIMIAAATIGIVSPSGAGGLGPFTALEQSIVSNIVARVPGGNESLTMIIALLNFSSSLAQASGSLVCGFVVHSLVGSTSSTTTSNNSTSSSSSNSSSVVNKELTAYETIFLSYAVVGGILALLYGSLPCNVELTEEEHAARQRKKEEAEIKVLKAQAELQTAEENDHDHHNAHDAPASPFLQKFGFVRDKTAKQTLLFAALFFMDSAAGGIVQQSFLSFYFKTKFDFKFKSIGAALAGVNILAGISSLFAPMLVKKFGAIKTMVFTHLPSNLMLIGVGLLGDHEDAAVGLLIARYALSQMDVPARQAYVNLVTPADEKPAVNGATTSVRSLGVALSGFFLMPVVKMAVGHKDSIFLALPFFVAGGAKVVYDLLVWYFFTKATGEVRGTEEDGEKKSLLQK